MVSDRCTRLVLLLLLLVCGDQKERTSHMIILYGLGQTHSDITRSLAVRLQSKQNESKPALMFIILDAQNAIHCLIYAKQKNGNHTIVFHSCSRFLPTRNEMRMGNHITQSHCTLRREKATSVCCMTRERE